MPITVTLQPDQDIGSALRAERQRAGRKNVTTALSHHLPSRLVDHLGTQNDLSGNLADWSDTRIAALSEQLTAWVLQPSGTEGCPKLQKP